MSERQGSGDHAPPLAGAALRARARRLCRARAAVSCRWRGGGLSSIFIGMPQPQEADDPGRVWIFSAIFGLVAGLCCLTPIVLVLLGVATISAANSLGNILYGEYRWAFRAAALASLVAAIVVHFRRRGVCTLDEARRRRNAILNFSVLALILGI